MVAIIKIACGRLGSAPYQEEVEGEIFGAWAAHDSINGDGFKVTMLRFGLAAPFDFTSMDDAKATAVEIDALLPDWSTITHAEIGNMGKELVAICKKHGGTRSGYAVFKGEPAPIDALPTNQAARGAAKQEVT